MGGFETLVRMISWFLEEEARLLSDFHFITLVNMWTLSLQPQALKLLWAESRRERQTEGGDGIWRQDISAWFCTPVGTVWAWEDTAGQKERETGKRGGDVGRGWEKKRQTERGRWEGGRREGILDKCQRKHLWLKKGSEKHNAGWMLDQRGSILIWHWDICDPFLTLHFVRDFNLKWVQFSFSGSFFFFCKFIRKQ